MIELNDIEGLVFRDGWTNIDRPGYFGRKRDAKISEYNDKYESNWRLAWCIPVPTEPTAQLGFSSETEGLRRLLSDLSDASDARNGGLVDTSRDTSKFESVIQLPFVTACRLYEESYFRWLRLHPAELEFACTYGECIDNTPTNIQSGRDYSIQESYSTHIQDIAMRNALTRLDRKFEGPTDKILIIRSKDSEGYRFGPGNIPFAFPKTIVQPSKCPSWASSGSVEDFWQSNKWLQIKQKLLRNRQ